VVEWLCDDPHLYHFLIILWTPKDTFFIGVTMGSKNTSEISNGTLYVLGITSKRDCTLYTNLFLFGFYHPHDGC